MQMHIEDEDDDVEVVINTPSKQLPEEKNSWVMVGRFLADKGVNLNAMKCTLANVWRPLKGVYISSVRHNLFLFCFFHEFKFKSITEAGPWTFDGKLLVWKEL